MNAQLKQAIPYDLKSDEAGSFQTDDAQIALEWCAVLASQKIDFELSRAGEVWLFSISPASFADAEKNITEYEGERSFFSQQLQEIDTQAEPLRLDTSLPFLFCSMLLFFFYGMTGPVASNSQFFKQGMLDPTAFYKQGEWWRVITALTLHADFPHVLGNCIFLTIFATIAGLQVGPGLALFSILISGILGNISTVLLFGSGSYTSLGASTAVFGALGIISILGMFNRTTKKAGCLKKWAPLAAGAALLAFTGTSSGSDLTAHLLGFTWGIGAGGGLIKLKQYRNNFTFQGIIYILAFSVIYYAWMKALN